MTIAVQKDAINVCLGKLKKLVDEKPVMPIRGCILIEVKDQTELRITAHSAEMQYTVMCGCTADSNFQIAIPFKTFFDTCKLLSNREIVINYTDKNSGGKVQAQFMAEIRNGKSKIKIACENPDTYPCLRFNQHIANAFIDHKLLNKALSIVNPFISYEDPRSPLFTGCSIRPMGNNKLEFVGTNAIKLARVVVGVERMEFDQSLHQEYPECVLPKKIADVAQELFTSQVRIFFDGRNCKFVSTFEEVIVLCIDGKFPNIRPMLTLKKPNQILVNRNELEFALKRINIFSKKENQAMVLEMSELNLNLSAEDEFNNNHIEEEIDIVEGREAKVGLNASIFLDCFKSIEEQNINLHINNFNEAIFIVPIRQSNDMEVEFLMMPLKAW